MFSEANRKYRQDKDSIPFKEILPTEAYQLTDKHSSINQSMMHDGPASPLQEILQTSVTERNINKLV